MQNVLLIGVNLIKEQSVIESNVDDKVLSKVILNVQEIQLKPILGKALYDTIISEVKKKIADESYTISDIYSEAINDYIQPFLTYATIAEFIPINSYKISNKGLQKLNDNSSASANDTELEYLKNYYDNFSSTAKSNLIKFLQENNLLSINTDTDIVSNSIGWAIEGRYRYNVTEEKVLNEEVSAKQFLLTALNTPPSSSTDTGKLGEFRCDGNYIYFCKADNNWVRTALTTWS